MSVVYVSATIDAAAGKEEDMRKVLSAVIAEVRAEKGCIRYDLHQCIECPAKFLFYEIWETAEDLDAHGKTPHIDRLRAGMGPLLNGEPEVLVYSAVDVAE